MFAYLGDIKIGINAHMSPTSSSEDLDNHLVEHAVVRGKPQLQDMGEALDKRSLSFFFDESFCNVEAEYNKLLKAQKSRSAHSLVMGNGFYRGKSYIIRSLKIDHKRMNGKGGLIRIEASLELLEAPKMGGLSFNIPGLLASALLNPFLLVHDYGKFR